MSTNTCLELTSTRGVLSRQLVPSRSAVPDRVILTDADYIGFEMGSVWSRLGAKATLIELLDRITPSMDVEVTK